jgi:hypothetical protein
MPAEKPRGPRRGAGDHDRRPRSHDEARRLIEEADRRRQEEVEQRENEYRRLIERLAHGDRRDQTAWLLLRYAAPDLGIRPIPPGQVFWDSPDLWVESSDPFGNPVASEQNYLHARVFNLGAFMASPVKVDFYWANPALGLGPNTMNFIGSEYVEIPSVSAVDVRCATAWVPAVVNGGHECVMVNCSCWLLDPTTHPFQPTLDRHVGQRNLHVVQGSPGQAFALALQVINVFPIAMATTVEAHFALLQPAEPARELSLLEVGSLAATFVQQQRWSVRRLASMLPPGSPARKAAQGALAGVRRTTSVRRAPFTEISTRRGSTAVASRLREERGVIQGRGQGAHAGRLLAALDAFSEIDEIELPRGIPLEQLELEALSFRTLDAEVSVPGDAHEGDLVVVHFSHQAGPISAGGYTLVVQIR